MTEQAVGKHRAYSFSPLETFLLLTANALSFEIHTSRTSQNTLPRILPYNPAGFFLSLLLIMSGMDLYHAALTGDLSAAKQMLQAEFADGEELVNWRNDDGDTAVHAAAATGNDRIIQLLLEAGEYC